MKILLAADGSAFTHVAARHLVSHIRWFATPPRIHILHVRAPLFYPTAAEAATKTGVEKRQREQSEAALAVAEKEMIGAGVAYTASWSVGDVVEKLARHVRDHRIDLVVMGSHGHGALANLALGSVATKCIATLEAPVMIVHKLLPPRSLTRRERVYGPRNAKAW